MSIKNQGRPTGFRKTVLFTKPGPTGLRGVCPYLRERSVSSLIRSMRLSISPSIGICISCALLGRTCIPYKGDVCAGPSKRAWLGLRIWAFHLLCATQLRIEDNALCSASYEEQCVRLGNLLRAVTPASFTPEFFFFKRPSEAREIFARLNCTNTQNMLPAITLIPELLGCFQEKTST